MNLLLLWLEDLYVLKNRFFNFPSNFTWQFLLKIEHLYSIKSSLKFSYSKKKNSQFLYLVPEVPQFLSSCPYLHLIL